MSFLVKDLIEGRGEPVTVTRDCSAKRALELMVEHDFSQLPVVTYDKKYLGMVTHGSILRSINFFDTKLAALRAADALETGRAFRDDEDLFDLLDDLRERYAVPIVDGEGNTVGIVTSYDTTEYFRRHSEDMMMVEDIEGLLKDYVRAALGAEEGTENDALREAIAEITSTSGELKKKYKNAIVHLLELQGSKGKVDSEHLDATYSKHLEDKAPIKGFEELTFGEYTKMFLHKGRWALYEPVFTLERGAIGNLLERVRRARNKLAHFNGDLDAGERASLRFCAGWLNDHQSAVEEAFFGKKAAPADGATVSDAEVDAAPLEESADARESRYAPLATWLQAVPADQDSVELTFEGIEKIIGDELPPYARRHRSWWANDSVGHVQSRQWLGVGWRTSRVDVREEKVVFTRINDLKLAYINFFAALLTELRNRTDLSVREVRPDGRSWHHVARLPEGSPHPSFLAFAFSRNKGFRVELYIDTGDEQRNKLIFDGLYRAREDIESALEQKVSWERLDGRRASRVAIYKDASINDDAKSLEDLIRWAVPTMIRFREVLSEHLPRDV
jgi:CBS domain-containing protein